MRLQTKDTYRKVATVEYDIGKRWESGMLHHSKSLALYHRIEEVDWVWGNDSFGWSSGGDGDNGETLMYLLDIIFDEEEEETKHGSK